MRTSQRRESPTPSRAEPSRGSNEKLWLITRRESDRVRVLTIDLDGGDGIVPVFSFEEEAKMFLYFEVSADAGWGVRETAAREFVAFFSGLSARRVALDPLPTGVGDEAFISLASLGLERFFLGLAGEPGLSSPSWLCPREGNDRKPIDENAAEEIGEGHRAPTSGSYQDKEG